MADSALQLPDSLVIQNVAEWKGRFVALLANGGLPSLDASPLKDIDTAGLQLLLAVAVEAEKQGSTINWESTSSELQDFAKVLGVTEPLNLEPA